MVSTVKTPTGVLSYPHLFRPRAVVEGAEPRYSCVLILNEAAQKTAEFQGLRKLANQVCIDFFGAEKMKDPRFLARLRKPFRPCTDKPDTAGYDVPGGVFISAWSQSAPKIVGPDTQEITAAGDIFPGQHARLQVSAFAYENTGNVGVSFSLVAVQITKRNAPRLDGRVVLPFDLSDEEEEDGDAYQPRRSDRAGDDIPF